MQFERMRSSEVKADGFQRARALRTFSPKSHPEGSLKWGAPPEFLRCCRDRAWRFMRGTRRAMVVSMVVVGRCRCRGRALLLNVAADSRPSYVSRLENIGLDAICCNSFIGKIKRR